MTLSRYRKGLVGLVGLLANVLPVLFPAGSNRWASLAISAVTALAVVLVPNAPKPGGIPTSTVERAPSLIRRDSAPGSPGSPPSSTSSAGWR